MNIYEKLLKIQTELKAPKSQYNSFGKYHYRSCEDILEGLKPLLKEVKATLIIDDDMVQVGDRYYIKATVTLIDIESNESIYAEAYAREDEKKTGMDLSQLTGSTSSYARKYALNGLFAIDDTKDADSTNTHGKDETTTGSKTDNKKAKPLSDAQIKRLYAIAKSVNIDEQTVIAQVKTKFNKEVKDLTKAEYDAVCKGYEGLKK